MSLTMIRLEPDIGRLARWAARHKLQPHRGGDDDLGYALHALLAATFGKEAAPRPFVLQAGQPIGARAPGPAALLAYSGRSGVDLLQLAQATAEPDVAEAVGLESFAAKTMPETWAAGQRFGFSVRVRPILRTDRGGNRESTREVDAFLASPPNSDRGQVYAEWLRRHVDGAAIESVTLDSFRLSSVQRRNADRVLEGQGGPDAAFSGTLRIEDGPAFAALLARGVGRHRAFGFGMLLLRPAR